jgi:hypothetical protein
MPSPSDPDSRAAQKRPELVRVHRFLQHEILARERSHLEQTRSDISTRERRRSSAPSSLSSQIG